MPLIDTSYFVGAELNLPGAGVSGNPSDTLLTMFIKEHETGFLVKALGRKLYRSFMTGLGLNQTTGAYANVTSGKAADAVDQKWKDLLNGKEYTDDAGNLQKWKGFIALSDDGNTLKQSIIANYIYYHFVRNNATQTSSIGEVAGTTENTTPVSPRFKVSSAWNKMHFEIKELFWFLQNNMEVYSEWQLIDGYKAMEDLSFINPFF
jgi:hypothetical protein